MATQKARFLLRSGTAAEWASANPILAGGEPGYETDTGVLKLGDGVTAWSSLPAFERNRQAANANLTAEAGLTGAADRVSYYTGLGAKALAAFTSAGRALVGAVDAAAQRAVLGLGSLATRSDITTAQVAAATLETTITDNDTKLPTSGAVADIAAGTPGHLKIQGLALQGVVKGEVTVSGAGNYAGRTDLDNVRVLTIQLYFTAAPGTISVRFTNNNGGSWSAPQTIISGIAGDDGIGWIRMNWVDGGFGFRALVESVGYDNAGILTIPSGCNGIQFAHSASGSLGYYDYYVYSGIL